MQYITAQHRFMNASLLDFAFPSSCVGCDTPLARGAMLCDICMRAVPLRTALHCGRCEARVPAIMPPNGKSAGIPRKICHRDHPYLLAAATRYAHPHVRKLVHALKFRSALCAAAHLGAIMARFWSMLELRIRDPLLVPIPLGARRERERGFNQADAIAQEVGRHLRCSIASHALTRIRETAPQSLLSGAAERHGNVAGAFAVNAPPTVRGRIVLLIDDVATSGATLSEAARALRLAGARAVIALVAAKA